MKSLSKKIAHLTDILQEPEAGEVRACAVDFSSPPGCVATFKRPQTRGSVPETKGMEVVLESPKRVRHSPIVKGSWTSKASKHLMKESSFLTHVSSSCNRTSLRSGSGGK